MKASTKNTIIGAIVGSVATFLISWAYVRFASKPKLAEPKSTKKEG